MSGLSVAMKACFGIFFFLLLQPSGANAQVPLPAGRSTVTHLELGYSYFNVSIPSTPSSFRTGLHGFDAGATLDLTSRFGVELAGSFGRGSDVFGLNHPTDILTFTGGPVVYLVETKRFSARARVLFGGSRQGGANLGTQGNTILTGFVVQPAWLAGGSLDYKLDRTWSFRISADYLRSSFFNSSGLAQAQNNLRTGVAIVYTFGRSYRRRSKED